jgi:hypothetical protein
MLCNSFVMMNLFLKKFIKYLSALNVMFIEPCLGQQNLIL